MERRRLIVGESAHLLLATDTKVYEQNLRIQSGTKRCVKQRHVVRGVDIVFFRDGYEARLVAGITGTGGTRLILNATTC